MSLHALALIGSALLVGQPASTGPRPVVAVFDIEAKGVKFEANELASLADYVSAQLTASGRFEVVPRAELKRALSTQKKESYRACYDESCQIEIGKEVAAEKSVAGSVSRFGKSCIVSLSLFDLAKATAEAGGTHRGGCTPDAVLTSLEAAVAQLSGRRAAAPVAVAAPPAVRSPPTGQPATGPQKERSGNRLVQALLDRKQPIGRLQPPAKVPVEIFVDFQCPYSKKLLEHVDAVDEEKKGQLDIRIRHMPLTFHKHAKSAALAAIAAEKQGKLRVMARGLFTMQRKLSKQGYVRAAKLARLDLRRLQRDMRSADTQARLDADIAEAKQRGVRGTPTTFIAGTRVDGSKLSEFDEVLAKALAER